MYERESFREVVSMLINWCTGGSLKECYCARCWRERKEGRVLFLNWLYYNLSRGVDIDHCQRVSRGGKK